MSITNDFNIESCNNIVYILDNELDICIDRIDSSYLQIGLVAIKSKNIFISYSGNVQALRYFLNEIYKIDKTKFDLLIIKVNKGIIKNIKLADKQLKEYNNPLETYFKDFYGMFLKANNQKEGIKSYNMVVSLLVNYYSNQ